MHPTPSSDLLEIGDLCDAEQPPSWGLPFSGQSSREPSRGRWHLATAASARSANAAPAGQPAAAKDAAKDANEDKRPNIVLVLMDDFSLELLATMPQAQRMRATGATYRNAHVVDSLCCPSRASIFTGRPPHQTGVLTNIPNDPAHPIGGYRAFTRNGNAAKSFNVPLQKSGYATGFVGKYMNGYEMSTNYLGKHFAPAKVAGLGLLRGDPRGRLPRVGLLEHLAGPDRHDARPAHREAAAHRAASPSSTAATRPTWPPLAPWTSCASIAAGRSPTSSRSRPTVRTPR